MKAIYKGIEFEIESEKDMKMLLDYSGNIEPEIEPFIWKQEKTAKKKTAKIVTLPNFTSDGTRKRKMWTKEEDKWLMENKDNVPHRTLAKTLGRKKNAIKMRVWYLSHPHSPVEVQPSKKYKNAHKIKHLNDFHKKVLGYLKDGTKQKDVAKLMRVSLPTVYNLTYTFKKMGLLQDINLRWNNMPSDTSGWDFAIVPKDKMDVAVDLIKSCATHKSSLSYNDIMTYLGLKEQEVRPFMIDVFNKQKINGYKVNLVDNKLVFV
jgi:hypothetical protein